MFARLWQAKIQNCKKPLHGKRGRSPCENCWQRPSTASCWKSPSIVEEKKHLKKKHMYHQLLKIRWPAENKHQLSIAEELLTISHYIQNCHEQWTLPISSWKWPCRNHWNMYIYIYMYIIHIYIYIYLFIYIYTLRVYILYILYTYYMSINRPASDASLWSSSSFLPWPQPPHPLRRSRSQLRREEPIAGDAGSFAELTSWAMPSRVCTDSLVVGICIYIYVYIYICIYYIYMYIIYIYIYMYIIYIYVYIYIYIWDIGSMYVYMIILPYSAYLDSLTLITQCEEPPFSHNCWWKLADHTSTWVYLYGTWPGRRLKQCAIGNETKAQWS